MKRTKEKYHFTKLFQFWGIVFILGIAISITIVEIIGSYRDFSFHSNKIRSNFIVNQQQILQQEVMRVVELISYEREQNNILTKNSIKERTYEAWSIANNIYQQNKASKSNSEIKQIILDALRPIRFENENGSFFLVDLDGTGLLLNTQPEMEGKSLLQLQNSHGQYVYKDMVEIVKEIDEGFYQYHCRKWVMEDKDSRKISFIKQFQPLNCFIGTGLYVEDIEKKIKDTILSTISRIRFGKEGYIFVNSFEGNILIGAGKRFSGTKKLWEQFDDNPEKTKALFDRQHVAALLPDGDFIYYTLEKASSPNAESPKISFIYGLPELQWLVGAEGYLDEIEAEIAAMQAELSSQITNKVICFTVITFGILTFSLLLFQKLNKKLRKDMDAFLDSANQLLYSNEPINRDQFESSELDQMAKKFNKIFKDKNQIQQRLIHEETALLQSEEKYNNTMDSTLFGVYIIQDLVFQYVNPALAAMFDYKPDEMEGKLSPIDLVVPEQRETLKKTLLRRAAGESGKPYDIKCIRRNGEIFDAMVLGAGIMHRGNPASVGSILDITDRKAAENKLQKSEERANALLESIPDMVFRVNDEGVFTDYKADLNELYVKYPDVIIGRKVEDLLPPDVAALINKYIRATLQTGKMHTFEYQLPMPEEGFLDFEARIVKSGEEETTGTVRNITTLKKALSEKNLLEKQLNQAKRMESIGLMAGGVAHDLNNILSGIVGYPELILLTLEKDSELRPQIEAIQQSGIRAAAVVDDLLTVARGAASTRAIQDINLLIREYLNSPECSKVMSLYPHVNINDELKAVHTNISCSQVHIKKCLMNLVTNGIEAIVGSGTVLVSTFNHTQTNEADTPEFNTKPGEYIVISIKDNGPGIAKEDLEHIFEPFYSKKVMERSGTGLGLTVVWNTVQDHNGKILVNSSHQGTTFLLYFPVSHKKTISKQVDNGIDQLTGNGEHILIVDDEELLQNIASNMLKHFGYAVHTVSTGEAAIEYVKRHKIDLLVIDMLMDPGINGYQTYKKILAFNPCQKAIIASGFSENTDVKATLQLGAGGFVKKPYSMEQLGRTVKEVLSTT
jgi:PAS domain S-box-containing protein